MNGFDPELIGKSIGDRLNTLRAALRRHDSFAFRPGEEVAAPGGLDDAAAEATVALVLRALRAACDPAGWRVLERLTDGAVTTAELADLLRCARIVAWEEVNDLVQAGLVSRELDGDLVRLTETGRGIVSLVHLMAASATKVVTP
ncbi:hypothetical protein SacmaDRAFT_1934 [Saccharomonospora marina XMU15]|uniref:HTH marR-type domain-containing protein n=1 Tax=Saccharomonospora marina XMU15 TaxID=882083 RepID=H5X7H3_9PSEU|nr:hypothetical protein [Saccharomonospora marina]EHR50193.1 hypothetical protein SacmaDRAFT_1934 [Saccharomonospora marina XMU15]